MDNGRIIIYGGSSFIARELLKNLSKKFQKFTIFCRNRDIVSDYLKELKIESLDIEIHEVDVLDLKKNYSIIDGFNKDIKGLIWLAGYTGDSEKEFLDNEKCEENIRINFLNPVLIINRMIPKIIPEKYNFLLAVASVAGLRGRKKRLFYSSAKSGLIAYLSGLRQKFNDQKINVITVIPGYINTKPFNITAPSFLISSPKKASDLICHAIYSKKEVVYISFIWRIIMFFINLIPEKAFKKFNF